MAKRRGNNLEIAAGRKGGFKVVLTCLDFKNEIYRKALFKYHGIRDLRVILDRLPKEKTFVKETPRKDLSSTPKLKSVRAHVPWLPTIASAKSSAVEYAGKSHNGTLRKLATNRKRSASITNDDLHQELLEKVSTPNRSLRPVNQSPNLPPISTPVPTWKKIFDEFQQAKAERQMKNAN